MSSTAEVEARDAPTLIVGILAGLAVGFAAQGSLPILIGAVIEGLDVAEAGAGLLASAEIGTIALASLLLAPRIHRVPRRRLALFGSLVAVMGHLLAVFSTSFDALIFARVIAGLGEGVVLAVANATLAGSANPERLTALLALIGGAGGGALLAVLSRVVEAFGYRGGFGVLLAIGVICLPLMLFLPSSRDTARVAHEGRAAHPILGIATLAAFLALALGGSAMWAFVERIGLNAGLSRETTGMVLAATMVLGLSGAIVAGWLGTRFGRALPLGVGLIALALATGGLGSVKGFAAYVALMQLWTFSFLFVTPYLMGTAAELDKEGRWAAATIGFWSVGNALGPASAGSLIAVASYAALGWLAAGSALVALALVVPVALVIRRKDPPEGLAADQPIDS